jgi:integrase
MNLSTREARGRLSAHHAPYFKELLRGRSIGYRKGTHKAAWLVRTFGNGKYSMRTLGTADDVLTANGTTILSYADAVRLATADDVRDPSRVTVSDAVKAYIEARQGRSRSPLSLRNDTCTFNAFVLPRFAAVPVAALTTATLRTWRDGLVKADRTGDEKRKSMATANKTWTLFRAVLNFAFTEGMVKSDDEWRRLKRFRNVDKARERFLSVDECTRLMNACPPDFRALVRGALLTGLRYSELCRLIVADFAELSVTVSTSKSGKARRMPLSDAGVEFFKQLTIGRAGDARIFTRADGAPWHTYMQHKRMGAAVKAARITPRCTFHDLRRSYGSLLINAGTPLAVISKLLGHGDMRITEKVYARLLDGTLRDALQANLPTFGDTPASNVEPIRKRT